MARGGGGSTKRNAKPQTSTPAKTATTTTTTSNVSSSIPSSFHPLPTTSTLNALLQTLPTYHVYLIHPDLTPSSQKRSIFLLPVLLNVVLTALLAWRAYYAVPMYSLLFLTVMGYETPWTVETNALGTGDLLGTISARTGYLMMDYAIFGLAGRWPWEFCFGVADRPADTTAASPKQKRKQRHARGQGQNREKAGALLWRLTLGFPAKEMVVRQSRRWDAALPLGQERDGQEAEDRLRTGKPARQWTREEQLDMHVKIEAALRKTYTQKTGYLLLDKFWDLDFRGMIDLVGLLEQGKVRPSECDHVALINVDGVWCAWYPYGRADNGEEAEENENTVAAAAQRANGTTTTGDGSANSNKRTTQQSKRRETTNDVKLRLFKDKLSEMNCEAVFYRWIEIVQYETSGRPGPGGGGGHFDEKRKAEAVGELRKMIQERGKDDRELWEAIGGLGGVPGLEEDEEDEDEDVGNNVVH